MRNTGERRNRNAALFLAISTITSSGWTTTGHSDESSIVGDSQQIGINNLKALEDPTILARRIWLDTEWSKFKDDSDTLEVTLGGLWSWRVSNAQEWAVRLKVPYTMNFAGDADDDYEDQALGDISFAAGTAFRLSKTWRTAVAIELRMPTGTNDTLSAKTWRLKEIGTVAWDATEWLTFSPSVEHNHSVAEQAGASPEHSMEVFLPTTLLLPDLWSVTAKYETKIDFENDNARTHSAKLQVAKRLKDRPLGFILSFKKPLEDESNKDFQVNFVSTYYFASQ
jgi:hypothetical protein